MNKNKIDIDDVKIKPAEMLPMETKKELEYINVDIKKTEIKLNIIDYFNIIKAYLMNKSLEELNMEKKFDISITLFAVLLIMIALIIIMLLQ